MFNWKDVCDDPNNPHLLHEWIKFYNSRIVKFDIFSNIDRDERILQLCNINSKQSLKILDVGFAEHGIEYVMKPDWFHAKLRRNPIHRVFGLDINLELIEKIRKITSLDDLLHGDATDTQVRIDGGNFDVIHAGDLIEHLSNPGDFLLFCKNNLKSSGRIIITTPNPICRYSMPTYKRQGFLANMEHTCWISPTNMNEFCRRYGLLFLESHYKMNKKPTIKNKLRKHFIKKWKDLYFSEFQYVLTIPQQQ